MRLQFDQIREKPFRWDETVQIDPADFKTDILQEFSPIHWKGEISFVAPNFLVRATVRYEQVLKCDRCLEPYREVIEKDMAALIEHHSSSESKDEVELTEGDLGVYPMSGDTVETQDFLLEELGLNLPMKPVCSPDCQGLCSQCGELLGDEDHDCPKPDFDPRWAALAALKTEN